MLIGFFPIAFVFLASYLLTLRWYERLGSIPAMMLGAVAQPLFTALLFSIGVAYLAQAMHDDPVFSFDKSFTSALKVSSLFTVILAIPIALLVTVPIQRRIKKREPKEYYDPSDGFEILVVIGVISAMCAFLAIGCIWLVVSER